jgi:hypothetical protein
LQVFVLDTYVPLEHVPRGEQVLVLTLYVPVVQVLHVLPLG